MRSGVGWQTIHKCGAPECVAEMLLAT